MTDPTAREIIRNLLALAGLGDRDLTPEAMQQLGQTAERARAYLAQSEPETQPTDEELLLWTAWNFGWDPQRGPVVVMPHPAKYARAVLARYGHQPPQPIPLSERLPGPGDCDGEGRCYVWDWLSCDWKAVDVLSKSLDGWGDTFWLPAHALPLPQ